MNASKPAPVQSIKARIAGSRDRLYRVALAWCGDEMLADDLVQEAMQSGITHCRQLRDERQLYAWLYSILRNCWNRHLRRNRVHMELEEQMLCEHGGPLGACQELETVQRVRRAVAELPVEQRQVISLVDLEEFSYCEVAAVLDIPIGTVMSRLHRARKHLLQKIDAAERDAEKGSDQLRVVK